MSGREYSLLHVDMHIERRWGYWVYNVLLPLIIISSSTFSAFVTPDIGDQISTVLTVLLTLTAFKFAIAEKLPAVSYQTNLDLFLLICLGIAFVILVVLCAASELGNLFDFSPRAMRWLAGGGTLCWWLLICVYWGLALARKSWLGQSAKKWQASAKRE